MAPGYKDDLEAAHERIESLEREVSRLRGAGPDKREPAAPKPGGARLGAGLVLMAAGALGLVGTLLFLVFPSHEAPLMFAMMAAAPVGCLVFLAIASRFMLVLRPWQAAIVSGTGSRVVTGGRLIRLPLLQTVDLMDLRVHLVEWSLRGAHAGDGTPVDARGYLAFAIQPVSSDIQRAAERFLGRDAAEMDRVVRETAEGAARSLIALHSRGELDGEREKLNAELRSEVSGRLRDLGMDVLSLGLAEATAGGER